MNLFALLFAFCLVDPLVQVVKVRLLLLQLCFDPLCLLLSFFIILCALFLHLPLQKVVVLSQLSYCTLGRRLFLFLQDLSPVFGIIKIQLSSSGVETIV